MRLTDVKRASEFQGHSGQQLFGVATDVDGRIALDPKPTQTYAALGRTPPETRFSIDLYPGPVTTGRIVLVLFDGGPELWRLFSSKPATLLITLPPDAELTPSRSLRADSDGTCASWYDGKSVHYANPTVKRSALGDQLVSCTIPPLRFVRDLFVELPFTWHKPLRARAGFGRVANVFQISPNLSVPGDIEAGLLGPYVILPVDITLHLAKDQVLIDSYPTPSGGSHSARRWSFDSGGDLAFTLESPAQRAWVQPLIDGSLLIAGVFFGLLPTLLKRSDVPVRERRAGTRKPSLSPPSRHWRVAGRRRLRLGSKRGQP